LKTGCRFAPEGEFRGRATGRFDPERPDDFGRNHWTASAGTRGRIGRNTQAEPLLQRQSCRQLSPHVPSNCGTRGTLRGRHPLISRGWGTELCPFTIQLQPREEDETLRDLVSTRGDGKEDQLRARLRLLKFLLRHDQRAPRGVSRWSTLATNLQLCSHQAPLPRTSGQYTHRIGAASDTRCHSRESRLRSTLAGLPTTTMFGSTDLITTAPIPTNARSPTVT